MAGKKKHTFIFDKLGNLFTYKNYFLLDVDSMRLSTPKGAYQLVKHDTQNYWYCVANGYKVHVMLKDKSCKMIAWY